MIHIVNGKWTLFGGKSAGAPQTRQGFPTAHRQFNNENLTFFRQDFHFENNTFTYWTYWTYACS